MVNLSEREQETIPHIISPQRWGHHHFMQCDLFSCQSVDLSLFLYHWYWYTRSLSYLVCNCAMHLQFSVCMYQLIDCQSGFYWAGSLPESVQMYVFRKDWTPSEEVRSSLMQYSVRTAGGCLTQTRDCSYFYFSLMCHALDETLQVSFWFPSLYWKGFW